MQLWQGSRRALAHVDNDMHGARVVEPGTALDEYHSPSGKLSGPRTGRQHVSCSRSLCLAALTSHTPLSCRRSLTQTTRSHVEARYAEEPRRMATLCTLTPAPSSAHP